MIGRLCVPLVLIASVASVAGAQQQEPGARWSFNPDAGAVYRRGDLSVTTWGFAERLWGPRSHVVSADAWRRVRQGAEVDFPRVRLPRTESDVRAALVYEVDLTDNNFFRTGRRSQVFENAYLALQHADDPGKGRVLFGENTHILSREDNLSSGNLPAINRSLVLEEHGSVNSFGTQWGVEASRALTSRATLALSAQDNRGSLNTVRPRYAVGNSIAAKLTVVAIDQRSRGRQLTVGVGSDYTRGIRDRTFTLASAIGAEPLGGAVAEGDKFSLEGDIAYTSALILPWGGAHPFTVEGEALASSFSGTGTDVGGGYVQLQLSAFDGRRIGDLDPFLRYDVVYLDRDATLGAAVQHAIRAGLNYNLPTTGKHVGAHLEYARNRIGGPAMYVAGGHREFGELRAGLRISAIRYVRH